MSRRIHGLMSLVCILELCSGLLDPGMSLCSIHGIVDDRLDREIHVEEPQNVIAAAMSMRRTLIIWKFRNR